MQRGVVLLGVVAFLALWPQAAAEVYDLGDPNVWSVVDHTQRLMHTCAQANSYTQNKWSKYNVAAFKEKSLFHSMYSDLVPCMDYFLQTRH
uniref:Conotoxin n=1 Tax=Conus betulinus TaxID=89764 RepID=A0A142C1A3_CONBE|nr:conotoxin [Conus betulinus]